MVDREQQAPVRIGELQQPHPPERRRRQIEGGVEGVMLDGGPPLLASGRSQSGEINRLQHARRCRDERHGLADIVPGKTAAEGFVPVDDMTQRRFERAGVEPPRQLNRLGETVSTAPWVELIDEPQALLGQRHRRGRCRRTGADRRRGGSRDSLSRQQARHEFLSVG